MTTRRAEPTVSGNPLGARARYLGHTVFRIHGTNEPAGDDRARRFIGMLSSR
jgi:lipoprotein-anchoring transpeptidase ErfK/SrfK